MNGAQSYMLTMEQLEYRIVLAAIEFVAHSAIVGRQPGLAYAIAADVDGDTDLDILSANRDNNTIAWSQNLNGLARFGPQRIVSESLYGASDVAAADIDGDGDLDIFAASSPIFGPGVVVWFENEDGRGRFAPMQIIGQGRSIDPVDLDGDGDVDVLSTDYSRESGSARIHWFENSDGEGAFRAKEDIASVSGSLARYEVKPSDVDGDGDADVVSVNESAQTSWYENRGILEPFAHERIDSCTGIEVAVGDLDSDGDPDVVASLTATTFRGPNPLVWFENVDGNGRNWQSEVISSTGGGILAVADLDGDGDGDVVSGTSPYSRLGDLAWYENTNGQGAFSPGQVIAEGIGNSSAVQAHDLDGDDDLDLLYASWFPGELLWYENIGTTVPLQPGDANGDGQFDQSDIVQVLQAGKFATGAPATWAEGDWNADGLFDRFDLIAALQTGNYLQGPYSADALFAKLGDAGFNLL